jgi:lactate dehydrogenase-like 2-hydroxyacid dehydrogenase
MKPTATLINTARGKCIDEIALVKALKSHQIAGVELDTIADWSDNNPLLKLDNTVLSPHSAFFTQESLINSADIIVKNVEEFVKGVPTNIVNS